MNGYDFDKTIYKGDSSTDFFVYMIFSRPYLLLFFLWYLIVLFLYAVKAISKKKTKELLFFFIPWHKNIDKIVNKFWEKHANGIQEWYAKQKSDEDVILSASLGFIIKPMMDTLHIKRWVATDYNIKTGKIEGRNCYGDVKVIQYVKLTGGERLDAFYSDSLSDLPMMKYAKKAYLVKDNKVKEIDVTNM